MARGGKRANSGRKTGTANARTRAIADKVVAEGVTPLEVMLDNMRFYHRGADELIAKLLAHGIEPSAQDPEDAEAGPHADLIDGIKQVLLLRQAAGEAAKDAAPFIHARLAPIDAKGSRKEDEVPLAERLKAYATNKAIEASVGKVVMLTHRK